MSLSIVYLKNFGIKKYHAGIERQFTPIPPLRSCSITIITEMSVYPGHCDQSFKCQNRLLSSQKSKALWLYITVNRYGECERHLYAAYRGHVPSLMTMRSSHEIRNRIVSAVGYGDTTSAFQDEVSHSQSSGGLIEVSTPELPYRAFDVRFVCMKRRFVR